MTGSSPVDARKWFHNEGYLEINKARLDHLAFVLRSTGLRTKGLSVIELGAGIGDHTQFWIDRGCRVTITEPREENLAILRERYPGCDIRNFDLDRDEPPDERFDIVYAYGLLYHLADPARGITTMASLCAGTLFLETCVSYGDDLDPRPVREDAAIPTQASTGMACRPTRPWIFAELKRHLPHVYQPGTQPTHNQFPTDWSLQAEPKKEQLVRTTFVASRRPIEAPSLFPQVLGRQVVRRAPRPIPGDGLIKLVNALGIRAVLDVGANTGQFAATLRASGFAGPITSFEPLCSAFAVLAPRAAGDASWTAHPFALGQSEGEAVLNVSANSFSSSLLAAEQRTLEAEPTVGPIDRQPIAVRRLDSVWPELGEAATMGPLLLKIDVQGFEPEVLAGAAGVIDRIDAVLLETSLVPVYKGEAVLESILPLMSGLGFHPVWMRPGWSDGDTGQVYQCDVLFARGPDVPRPGTRRAKAS